MNESDKEELSLYIRWIPSLQKDIIFLSPVTLLNFEIKSEKITLHLGIWTQKLEVRPLNSLDEATIGLSDLLFDPLTIPDTIPYEMSVKDDNLYLGPVIAIVVKKGELSHERLGFWTDYCRDYSKIKGLIYFCKVRGIDLNTKTINGYYYNPNKEEPYCWEPGIFPYPGVVFQRTGIPQDILQDLQSHTTGKVFNAYLFNKWEMWKVLSKAGFTNTPYTVTLRNRDSLKKMLSLYKSVYLKPAKGRFGKGIQSVEKAPGGYLFKREDESNQCSNFLSVYKLIKKHKKKRKYIIQQSVPLYFQGKLMDFRVILQKDETQQWSCTGIIAKLGFKEVIFTNAASAMFPTVEALGMVWGLTLEEALEKENEIIRICTEACHVMERAYGILGDVGIDVALDKELNVWILEINKIHQHTMFKKEYPDLYYKVVTKPLAYAKSLAGFS